MESVDDFIQKYEQLKQYASADSALYDTLELNSISLRYINPCLAKNEVVTYDDLLTIDDEYPDKNFILGTTALIYYDLMIFGKGDNDDFDRENMGIKYLNAGIANGCTNCMISMGEQHKDFSDDTKCN